MAYQSISRLQVPDSLSSTQLSLFSTVSTTTGINLSNLSASLISEGTHAIGINQGLAFITTYLANTSDVPIFRIDRVNPVTTAGRKTTLAFSGGAASEDMGSISVITEAAGAHGLRLVTASAFADNTLPAFAALSDNKVGLGIPDPQYRLHVSDAGDRVATPLVGTETVVLSTQAITSPSLTLITSNTNNSTRGIIKGVKSKGTLLSPLTVADTDYTLGFLGGGYDGTSVLTTAGIQFQIMGTVSTGVMPQGIVFETGPTNNRVERARIMPSGRLGLGVATPGATLSVHGGLGIGTTYSSTTVGSGNLILDGFIGAGTSSPVARLHTYFTSANVTHVLVETSTNTAYLGFKSASTPIALRIGVDTTKLVFQTSAVTRVDLQNDGLRYAADYSATWTDRSLPDKAYVDAAVAGGGGGGGITSINTLTAADQTLASAATGTDFLIQSTTATHTFFLPPASASATGKLTSTDWTTFNNKVDDVTATSPLSVTGTSTINVALTGIIPPANGGTGSGVQNWVDLTTNQVNIAGDKGFTTSLHYGAAILPTSSHFGTTVQTAVFLKGGTTNIVESNFNNSQGLVLYTEINSGTQYQTSKIIAAGSDTFNSASEIAFQARPSGVGQNWVTCARVIPLTGGGMYIGTSATGSNGAVLTLGRTGGSSIAFEGGASNYILQSSTDANNAFAVTENGTIRAHIVQGSDGWISGSDIRRKKEIETLEVLPYIHTVRGASYRLTDGRESRAIGVIAQEVELHFPEAVFSDGTEEGMKSVSYNAIAAIALQACKELKEYIEILEERIKVLEEKYNDKK